VGGSDAAVASMDVGRIATDCHGDNDGFDDIHTGVIVVVVVNTTTDIVLPFQGLVPRRVEGYTRTGLIEYVAENYTADFLRHDGRIDTNRYV
jgi:hypothetical protein